MRWSTLEKGIIFEVEATGIRNLAKLLQNESKLNVQKSWAFATGPVELNLSLMRVNLGATHILNLCRSIELYKMKLV